jgi:hypothetical protein
VEHLKSAHYIKESCNYLYLLTLNPDAVEQASWRALFKAHGQAFLAEMHRCPGKDGVQYRSFLRHIGPVNNEFDYTVAVSTGRRTRSFAFPTRSIRNTAFTLMASDDTLVLKERTALFLSGAAEPYDATQLDLETAFSIDHKVSN